jgi:hypothetical protein
MAVDDMPDPTSDAPPKPSVDDIDAAYQAGYDDAGDARAWIKSALYVLTADIDPDGPGTMTSDAVRQMRTESARMIARLFRQIAPDDAAE